MLTDHPPPECLGRGVLRRLLHQPAAWKHAERPVAFEFRRPLDSREVWNRSELAPRFGMSRVLVIDPEATCWQGPRPPGEGPEIIGIGNAILRVADPSVEPGPEVLVRPTRSTVSTFCTELTGIAQPMVDEGGLPLADAIGLLRDAHGDPPRMVWVRYGECERRELTEECQHHGIRFPLGHAHANVKRLVALSAGRVHEEGMAGAMRRLGVQPLPGSRHHRGYDDAVEVARLLGSVLWGASGLVAVSPCGASQDTSASLRPD